MQEKIEPYRTVLHATKYKELFYTSPYRGLWRFSAGNGVESALVGPQYPTEKALLQDMDRYAGVYGCESAVPEKQGETIHLREALRQIRDARPTQWQGNVATLHWCQEIARKALENI